MSSSIGGGDDRLIAGGEYRFGELDFVDGIETSLGVSADTVGYEENELFVLPVSSGGADGNSSSGNG